MAEAEIPSLAGLVPADYMDGNAAEGMFRHDVGQRWAMHRLSSGPSYCVIGRPRSRHCPIVSTPPANGPRLVVELEVPPEIAQFHARGFAEPIRTTRTGYAAPRGWLSPSTRWNTRPRRQSPARLGPGSIATQRSWA